MQFFESIAIVAWYKLGVRKFNRNDGSVPMTGFESSFNLGVTHARRRAGSGCW